MKNENQKARRMNAERINVNLNNEITILRGWNVLKNYVILILIAGLIITMILE